MATAAGRAGRPFLPKPSTRAQLAQMVRGTLYPASSA
jgi:hypothetical protein